MIEEIEKAIKICKENGLKYFFYRSGDIKLSFSFLEPEVAFQSSQITHETQPEPSLEHIEPEDSNEIIEVKSNGVGRIRLVDKEGKEIVSKGAEVKKGQLLGYLIILGIEHEITSPENGIIDSIEIQNDQVVDYGKVLMKIKKVK